MARMKRFQGSAEYRMRSTDLPIALLRPVSYNSATKEMLVDSELLCMRTLVHGLSIDEVPCVMSMSNMSLSQLRTLGVCKAECDHVYCLRQSPDLPTQLQDSECLRCVLRAICVRGKAGLPSVSSFTPAQKAVLEVLQQNCFVTEDLPLKLTEQGLTQVCFAKKVLEPKRVLKKLDVPPHEQSKWQLLQSLLDQGWEARVAHLKDCKRANAFQVVAGQEHLKVVYLVQQNASAVCDKYYLLALSLAADHGQPVPHGQPQAVYINLLRGLQEVHEHLPLPRASAGFRAISDGGDWLDALPQERPKKRPRKVKQAAVKAPGSEAPPIRDAVDAPGVGVIEADQESVVSNDTDAVLHCLEEFENDADDEDALQDVDVDEDGAAPVAEPTHVAAAAPAPPSAGAGVGFSSDSSSSDSSSSYESSSSSSSSSSSGSSDSSARAGPKAKAKAAIAGKARAKAKAKADPAPGATRSGGGVLLDSTFFWRECKFTAIKDKGVSVGYEATCRNPAHGKFCRRTLKFAPHGGSERVLLKLKWWLLQASEYDSREAHVRDCPRELPNPEPSPDQLEAAPFGV